MAFYAQAWLLYGLGLFGIIFLGWRVSRSANATVRIVIMAALMAWFATPWYAVAEVDSSLAPAFIIVLYESVSGGAAERAGLPILWVFIGILSVALAGRYLLLRLRPVSTPNDAD